MIAKGDKVLRKLSLTGIRPSGNLHLGNYLGTIREGLKLQERYDCIYFVADMHALTTAKEPKLLGPQTYDIVAAWVAFGLDLKRNIIFRQSDLPLTAELAWYLSCCTGMGLLQKAHSFKDALAQEKEVNHGVFAYPLLMAADIMLYDADVVPVGKDQKQHVEMARDMAGSINAIYGEILKLPEPLINESVMTIPGLDGRKMSKSYNNEIPIFAPEKELQKKIMSITTDSTALEAPKSLDDSVVGQLFRLFATEAQYKDLSKRLAAGGLGWGHAKQELFEVTNTHLREARERYLALRSDEPGLDKILDEGAERGAAIAIPILDRVRKAIGLRRFSFSR